MRHILKANILVADGKERFFGKVTPFLCLLQNYLRDLVCSTVEETLNALLDHEAEELVNAEKYEHSGDRKDYRSGYYSRNFQTTAGDVTSTKKLMSISKSGAPDR